MRYALGVEYDGSAYRGWQRQGHDAMTVQQTLEEALSQIADHDVTVICAGRTDSGVHGVGQVVHFDTASLRPRDAWVLGTNTLLPCNVGVRWCLEVGDDFHARYRAFARRYCYLILNSRARPTLGSGRVTWQYRPLDAAAMNEAGRLLLGTHDFSSFRAAECQAKTPVKTLTDLTVERRGDMVVLSVRADAFLHHMVRNIAGVLMKVGMGKKPVTWVEEVLQARDRRVAAPTAAPDGLYLMGVEYPDAFGIPRVSQRYPFLVGGMGDGQG
jgi:tRNA pseudouridine38-40 synthase